MDAIQCVGIISKPDVPQAKALVPELIAWLELHSAGIPVGRGHCRVSLA